MSAHRQAASGLLARMLTGLSITAPPGLANADGDPEPDFGAGEFELLGENGIAVTIHLPSGDQYRVTIDWLKEESP